MTTIFSCICGKYDDSQDLENDFKDKHEPLNEHVIIFYSLFNISFIRILVEKSLFILRKSSPSITYQNLDMMICVLK